MFIKTLLSVIFPDKDKPSVLASPSYCALSLRGESKAVVRVPQEEVWVVGSAFGVYGSKMISRKGQIYLMQFVKRNWVELPLMM